jgi:hypothetical protein
MTTNKTQTPKIIYDYCNGERVTFTLNKNAGYGWSMGRAYDTTIAGEHWTIGEVADADEYHDDTTTTYSTRWEMDGDRSRYDNGDPIDSDVFDCPDDAVHWLCQWLEAHPPTPCTDDSTAKVIV